MPRLAIIGGTGIYDPSMLNGLKEHKVVTEYGEIDVITGQCCGEDIVFMNRHGKGHALPPHRVNYRGNIMALKNLGVERILATAAVGSLNPEMGPGSFVLCDQFMDFTKSRPQTFYEDGQKGVVHIDMTEPYCAELRNTIYEAACSEDIPVIQGGTYVCTEGPRFETPAEIRMYRQLGGDLVGMTGVPEVVLAREAEICYATVAVVTNYAAGIAREPLTHAEVLVAMRESSERFRKLILAFVKRVPHKRNCLCQNALGELGTLGK
ncbi:methylthioadenosine phosphorylase [Thermincola ferriacetica]|uniref:Probable 6-oxopurine nucleoside phosphorylase n=1 Tax=Thermincola ferriacetica TaxID=281456 RepID=A0A0L6W204_9FIRM|nr:S-methyl-5'-thioadenosine phosphorylase [Thermincola ferriacetica]KNZ69617.1 methylthioadenosine phosphorylase [Thermincola ferriacetica]